MYLCKKRIKRFVPSPPSTRHIGPGQRASLQPHNAPASTGCVHCYCHACTKTHPSTSTARVSHPLNSGRGGFHHVVLLFWTGSHVTFRRGTAGALMQCGACTPVHYEVTLSTKKKMRTPVVYELHVRRPGPSPVRSLYLDIPRHHGCVPTSAHQRGTIKGQPKLI